MFGDDSEDPMKWLLENPEEIEKELNEIEQEIYDDLNRVKAAVHGYHFDEGEHFKLGGKYPLKDKVISMYNFMLDNHFAGFSIYDLKSGELEHDIVQDVPLEPLQKAEKQFLMFSN